MDKTKTFSASSFDEALRALDQMAQSKKTEIENVASEKMEMLQEGLAEMGPFMSSILGKTKEEVSDVSQQLVESIQVKSREVVKTIDENVRAKPWMAIGITGLAAVTIGFLLAKSK